MHKFAVDQRRRAVYIVALERDFSVRLTYTLHANGSFALQRTTQDQDYWTLQRRIEPLLR